MQSGKVRLREIREIVKMNKIVDFRNFRMPDGKCQQIIKIQDFRNFWMPRGKGQQIVNFPDARWEMSTHVHNNRF